MKIIHAIPNLLKGGAQRLAINICNELQSKPNIELKLVVFDETNEFKNITKNSSIINCNASVIPSITGHNTINIEQYEKIIDEFQPDIIHSHLYLSELIVYENVRQNIKYYSHCHANMVQLESLTLRTFVSRKKLTDFYERKHLISKYKKANNTFIAISNDTTSYLKRVLPEKISNNVVLFHNAIDLKLFENKKRQKYSNEIKMINVGNLLDRKNQIFLLDVVKYLKDKLQQVHLTLVGDGENKGKIFKKVSELGIESEVTLIGGIDRVEEQLWNSNVYVHSALYEPFGLVLIEAMAAKIPVVCLDGHGNTDIIKNGENGFIIKDPNANIFGDIIIKLMKDKILYNKIRKNAYAYSQEFCIEEYCNKLLKIYSEN